MKNLLEIFNKLKKKMKKNGLKLFNTIKFISKKYLHNKKIKLYKLKNKINYIKYQNWKNISTL
jgi:hypothetical protein